MKIIMYGAEICSDCVEAKTRLESVDMLELDYRDITESTKTLKEFLYFRDHDEMFASVIESGGIGIPFFILEGKSKTFEMNDFLDMEGMVRTGNACSIDGKGC